MLPRPLVLSTLWRRPVFNLFTVPALALTYYKLSQRRLISAMATDETKLPLRVGSFKITLGPLDLGKTYGLESGSMTLTRWQSENSGLKVVHFDHEGVLGSATTIVSFGE